MDTKKEFKYFTIANHEAEEKYLSNMHRNGWKFKKVTGLGVYHFEKCECENVVYQLDYNQQGIKNKDEYVRMFADCGWEYIQEYAGFSYFRKNASEMNGDERIFNDEESKTAMIGRVFAGRILPLLTIFSACLVPQFVINLTNGRYVISAVLGAIIAIYLVVFALCAIFYLRKKLK